MRITKAKAALCLGLARYSLAVDVQMGGNTLNQPTFQTA
jgi:hypothetical protein